MSQSRFVHQRMGLSFNFVAFRDFSWEYELDIITDRKTGAYKITEFCIASVDMVGLDLSISGYFGKSYARDYKDINDAYEGLKDGGYNFSDGPLGFSMNEDGRWACLFSNMSRSVFTFSGNINYSITQDFYTDLQNVMKNRSVGR